MEKKTKILLFLLIIFSFFFFSFSTKPAKAQEEIEPEVEYPEFAGQEPTKSIPDYVRYVYQFSVGATGFLAMLMIIIQDFH